MRPAMSALAFALVAMMLVAPTTARVVGGARALQQHYHLPPPPITPPQHFPPLLPVPPGTYVVPNLDGFWPWPPYPISPPPRPGWPTPPPNFPSFPAFPNWNIQSVGEMKTVAASASENTFNALAAIFTVGGLVMLITTIAFARKRAEATTSALDAEQATSLLRAEDDVPTYGTDAKEPALLKYDTTDSL